MATDAELLFSREEYAERLNAVRKRMRQLNVQVLLVDESEHVFHLTGFCPDATMYQVCVVPLDDDPIMVLRKLFEATIVESTWLHDYVAYSDSENPVAVLAATLKRRGWANTRIGVELDSYYLTVRQYEAIKRALAGATFVDFSGVMLELRLRKSPQEVAYLRQSARIADASMLVAIGALSEGKSEREAAIAASRSYIELGADNARVGRITAGRRSGSIHGAGDIVEMEFVPFVHGYTARLMRPVVIGPPSSKQSETAKALIEIQDQQLAAMKPGAIAKDIDRICREQVLKAKLRDSYDNITGYTVGFFGNPIRTPRASDFTRVFLPTSDWALEPGMVFHMYIRARGMTFSETVLITENGHERLTQLERKLFVR